MSEAVRSKPPEELGPYEAVLRAFGYYERVTPEEHATVRPILERAVAQRVGSTRPVLSPTTLPGAAGSRR